MSIVRNLIRRRGDQDGAMAIEFAIFAPLLILLVFAVVQFGIWINARQGVHAAAREGARIGSLSTTTVAQIEARIEQALDPVQLAELDDPSILPGPCVNRSGEDITVQLTGTVGITIPFWESFTLPVSGTGVFRCE